MGRYISKTAHITVLRLYYTFSEEHLPAQKFSSNTCKQESSEGCWVVRDRMIWNKKETIDFTFS